MSRAVQVVVLVAAAAGAALYLRGSGSAPPSPAPAAQASSPPAGAPAAEAPAHPSALVEARAGVKARVRMSKEPFVAAPVVPPPEGVLERTSYPSPTVGDLAAYITPDPRDGRRHPAIVWITGGDCASIGDVWTEQPPENDQSAGVYRKVGVATMYPSLRGGNENPGSREFFYGEVDDVLAAAAFLASRPWVDPKRVYLGGHSTGGTLALLVAEAAPPGRFRAIFSFGPVDDVRGYGDQLAPIDASSDLQVALRAPIRWLDSIRTPTFVIEGTGRGNIEPLRTLARESRNPAARFLEVEGAGHFSVLGPVNAVIAERIVKDTGAGAQTGITLTAAELSRLFAGK